MPDNPTFQEMITTGHPTQLHIGCGERRLPGFVHVDMREECSPDVVAMAHDLGRWHDNEVDLIYACHVLEHYAKNQVGTAFREFHRVLRPGGVLRVSVPHIKNIMKLYVSGGVCLPRIAGLLWGRQDYANNFHYMGWDYETLSNDLREHGFYHVQRWMPSIEHPKGYHDISFAYIFTEEGPGRRVSLNLQCRKIGA